LLRFDQKNAFRYQTERIFRGIGKKAGRELNVQKKCANDEFSGGPVPGQFESLKNVR